MPIKKRRVLPSELKKIVLVFFGILTCLTIFLSFLTISSQNLANEMIIVLILVIVILMQVGQIYLSIRVLEIHPNFHLLHKQNNEGKNNKNSNKHAEKNNKSMNKNSNTKLKSSKNNNSYLKNNSDNDLSSMVHHHAKILHSAIEEVVKKTQTSQSGPINPVINPVSNSMGFNIISNQNLDSDNNSISFDESSEESNNEAENNETGNIQNYTNFVTHTYK